MCYINYILECLRYGSRLHVFVSIVILYIQMHTNVCVRGIHLVFQVCPCVGPWFEMLPLFCKLFVTVTILTRDFFLQNFRPQIFRDSYFAEVLHMKFVSSSEYIS
jgi:hypothetical protein